MLFCERDDDGRPLPKPKAGAKPRFKPTCYKELFFYVWREVRELPAEEIERGWADYVAEREAAGQPVDAGTGRPLQRGMMFDPLSREAAEEAEKAEGVAVMESDR